MRTYPTLEEMLRDGITLDEDLIRSPEDAIRMLAEEANGLEDTEDNRKLAAREGLVLVEVDTKRGPAHRWKRPAEAAKLVAAGEAKVVGTSKSEPVKLRIDKEKPTKALSEEIDHLIPDVPPPVTPKTHAVPNPKVQESLQTFALSYSNANKEFGRAVTDQGNTIFEKTSGHPNYIEFTGPEFVSLDDAHFTHNHPTGRAPSVEDVVLAIEGNLRSLHAIGYNWEYGKVVDFNINRPKGGWPNKRDLEAAVKSIAKPLIQRFDQGIQEGKIQVATANLTFQDELWRSVQSKIDIGYSVNEVVR